MTSHGIGQIPNIQLIIPTSSQPGLATFRIPEQTSQVPLVTVMDEGVDQWEGGGQPCDLGGQGLPNWRDGGQGGD